MGNVAALFGRGGEQATRPVGFKAMVGAGCYWGTEKFVRSHKFHHGSVVDVRVGFAGGEKEKPTYREVCSGKTGHVEVAEITYASQRPSDMYRELLELFFRFHDPTTLDRQGNDRGSQYASVIFCYGPVQRQIAELTINDLQKAMDSKGHTFAGDKVVTQVRDAPTFYPAHEDHQNYLEKNPGGYCNHRFYLSAWPGTTDSLPPELASTA